MVGKQILLLYNKKKNQQQQQQHLKKCKYTVKYKETLTMKQYAQWVGL